MPQELFSVVDYRQGGDLLLGRPDQQEAHVRMAEIWRNEHFSDSRRAHARVGKLVADQFLQLFAEVFGDAFIAMGIQTSG